MGQWRVKFPCGLEIEESGFGVCLADWKRDGLLKKIESEGCLIHGKKCKGVSPFSKNGIKFKQLKGGRHEE